MRELIRVEAGRLGEAACETTVTFAVSGVCGVGVEVEKMRYRKPRSHFDLLRNSVCLLLLVTISVSQMAFGGVLFFVYIRPQLARLAFPAFWGS